MQVPDRDILKVYKQNYDELTYQIVCLTLANKLLTAENEKLREALDTRDVSEDE